MLENKSSFEQLDDVLGNLIKEQIKQKTIVNNKQLSKGKWISHT